jgi:hypothetical protein
MLISNTQTTGKLTISHSDDLVVRCMGRLLCDCGTPVKASDVVIEYNGDDEIMRVHLHCSGCYADLLEVAESC